MTWTARMISSPSSKDDFDVEGFSKSDNKKEFIIFSGGL